MTKSTNGTLKSYLAHLKSLEEKATKGPWAFRIDPITDSENAWVTWSISAPYVEPGTKVAGRTDILRSYGKGYWNGFSELTDNDFSFIAASREAVPTLRESVLLLLDDHATHCPLCDKSYPCPVLGSLDVLVEGK